MLLNLERGGAPSTSWYMADMMCAGIYTRPVCGLYDMGCQSCAPQKAGWISRAFFSGSFQYSATFSLRIGRPVFMSMPVAQLIGMKFFADSSSPVARSIT
ncbi:hypothetical protein D3C73_1376110 [compost metagenome]